MWFPISLLILGVAALPSPIAKDLPKAHAIDLPASNITTNQTNITTNQTNITTNQTDIPSRHCGVGPPSVHLVNAHRALRAESLHKRAINNNRKYTVNTYFHVVTSTKQAKSITPSMISNQFGALQAAYAPSNINFRLLGTTTSVNDTWAKDGADADMKAALRKGNYSTLNVYFQTALSNLASGQSSQLLGYCTLPTGVTYVPCAGCAPREYPASDYMMDGCNVHAGTMPGGSLNGYNMGKTAVHEVGHWFGLLHTFQDNSCSKGDAGDFIDDTPQQSVQTDGCPAKKDSCPQSPGLDSVHNFMDYSTDKW